MRCLEPTLRCVPRWVSTMSYPQPSDCDILFNNYLLDYILPVLSLGVLILIVTRLLFRLRLFHLVIALSSRRYIVLGSSSLIVYSVLFAIV